MADDGQRQGRIGVTRAMSEALRAGIFAGQSLTRRIKISAEKTAPGYMESMAEVEFQKAFTARLDELGFVVVRE